ncbi:MAG: aldolase catalytic domain-containing protein [Treponema sp.]|nr:aldolase catalytic domain-containing protein [Treponema sp.]
MSVRLLDCTLRDGGHVNKADFGADTIKGIVNSLVKSQVNIIELGFLKNTRYSKDTALFAEIEYAYGVLPEEINSTEFSLMIRPDVFDAKNISPYCGKIKYIRLAFYYEDLPLALHTGDSLRNKGYTCIFNPVNIMGYDAQTMSKLLTELNNFKPYAVTIVDTFGAMMPNDLNKILNLFHEYLNPSICIGLHPHENLCMSFALAQIFIEKEHSMRDIIVDASLMGMGRAPGNLPIELLINYMNQVYGKGYCLSSIMNVIEEYILPIRKKYSWGYSPAYFLSAKQKAHRSYVEHLLSRGCSLPEIEAVSDAITVDKRIKFDKDYADALLHNIKEYN